MPIQKIAVRNVKYLNGDFVFGRITVITGQNQVGKTALFNAATLAMLGYLPELGRQASKTRGISSGTIMRVESQHDDYTRVQTWSAKYTNETVPPGREFANVEMLSLKEFFDLTATAKQQFLLRVVGFNSEPSVIWSHIITEMGDKGFHGSDLDSISDLERCDGPADKWMDSLVTISKARLSDLNMEIKGAKGAISETTTMDSNASLAETVTNRLGDLQQVKSAREALQAKINQATAERAEAEGVLSATLREGQRLKSELTNMKAAVTAQPQCGRCGGPVACPACAVSKSTTTLAITEKEKQREKLLADFESQKAVVARLKSVEAEVALPDIELKRQQEELELAQSRWDASLGRQQAVQRAQAKIDGLDTKKKMLAQFAETVVEKVGSVLTGAMESTLTLANRLITPVLGFGIAYNGEAFGYQRDKTWVNLQTFSGSEKMVVNAAICMALTHASPERILLLDELGTMTPQMKLKFVMEIRNLISDGTIHQMIAVDPAWNLTGVAGDDITIITVKSKAS